MISFAWSKFDDTGHRCEWLEQGGATFLCRIEISRRSRRTRPGRVRLWPWWAQSTGIRWTKTRPKIRSTVWRTVRTCVQSFPCGWRDGRRTTDARHRIADSVDVDVRTRTRPRASRHSTTTPCRWPGQSAHVPLSNISSPPLDRRN